MYYAKSKPDVLTIVEHTLDVVNAVKALATAYGNELSLFTSRDFELLEMAAIYHDIGKYSGSFQNAIRPSIDKNFKRENILNYPHNYLSTAVIPFTNLKGCYSKEDAQIVVLAVGFHHERDIQPTEEMIHQLFNQYLIMHLEQIRQEMPLPIEIPETANRFAIKTVCSRETILANFDERNWLKYILIKGLLQRADHAASAKRKNEELTSYVEDAVMSNVGEQTKAYLERSYTLRPLQTLTYANQQKNIILVAQTGSGKTEAALLWIGHKKGFITLPLRVSLNAMFDRIHGEKGIAFKSTGLLHSSALDHLLSNAEERDSFEQSVIQTDHAKLLAKKLTLSTIDQLFKFPLLYRGFETELATLAYSKVVIDEIQAYDPHIVAILLRGIEMIHQLGGQWMIMTATLPQIFLDELQKKGLLDENTVVETVLIPDDRTNNLEMPRRHRIQLCTTFEDMLEDILQFAEVAKVLIVVNTVKKALTVYDMLAQWTDTEKLHLLHGQFTKKDRLPKEQQIKAFAQLDNEETGIWVTTQIVEASLDVDFDYLFTEAATPDALFQRFGRCNRKGKRFEGATPEMPNVFVFTQLDQVSGIGTIYEQVIVEKGLEQLMRFDGHLLGEPEKINIVSDVFSKDSLYGTDYLKKFEQANKELEMMRPFERDKQMAQHILRDIQSCSFVAGKQNYEIVTALIEQYEQIPKTLDAQKRSKLKQQIRVEIDQYTISVNPTRLKYIGEKEDYSVKCYPNKDFRHLYYSIDIFYSASRGLDYKLDGNFDVFY